MQLRRGVNLEFVEILEGLDGTSNNSGITYWALSTAYATLYSSKCQCGPKHAQGIVESAGHIR